MRLVFIKSPSCAVTPHMGILPSTPREQLPGVFVFQVKLLFTGSVITQGCVLGN